MTVEAIEDFQTLCWNR